VQESQNLQRKRELYGSPPFTQRPQIDAGGVFLHAPNQADPEGKYFPLDKLKVANKSNSDVVIFLDTNPDRALYVEAGTQEIFEQIQPFRSYKIENLNSSTGISSDELKVTARKSPLDADKAAQRQAAQENQGPDAGKLLGAARLFLG
jgi:hypothetical protein